uniref:Uncharacterized protein n=1 Tax=Romanomermis culicivorax TaxID=13658 RepID=A0A915IZ83_ROMCU
MKMERIPLLEFFKDPDCICQTLHTIEPKYITFGNHGRILFTVFLWCCIPLLEFIKDMDCICQRILESTLDKILLVKGMANQVDANKTQAHMTTLFGKIM